MFTNPHPNLSSYLVRPRLVSPRKRWAGFRTRLLIISRATNPQVVSRTIASLFVWGVICFSWNYVTTPHNLPGQAATAAASHTNITQPTANRAFPALATVASAQTLTSGPTGQLLPPGTMAPDRTYANNYTRGQCTWYVAGRRQVPPNWGNANAWYYHAVAAGWAVGVTPAIAAIAWTPAGSYGHVALVEQVSPDGQQVYVSEMNYRGVGVKSYRWAASSSFKYIY